MSDSVYVKIFAGKEGVEIAQDVDTRIYEPMWKTGKVFLWKYSLTRYRGVMFLSGLGYLTVRRYCPCNFLFGQIWTKYKEMTNVCERKWGEGEKGKAEKCGDSTKGSQEWKKVQGKVNIVCERKWRKWGKGEKGNAVKWRRVERSTHMGPAGIHCTL